MSSFLDKRRMVPRHEGLSAVEVDRNTGFPDLRIQRQGSTVLFAVHRYAPEGSWTWGIERSGSPGGPFKSIVQGLPSTESLFRDDTLPPTLEQVQYAYYRMRVQLEDGTENVFGYRPEWDKVREGEELHGLTWGPDGVRSPYAPGPVREIRQRVQMLIEHNAGMEALLYRKAFLEGRCPTCVNPYSGTRSTQAGDYCRSCLNTGFVGGYYTPMRTLYITSGSVGYPQETVSGTHSLIEEQRVIFPHWPILQPETDILRLSGGMLLSIGNVGKETFNGHITLLTATLSEISRTNPLNKLPFPDGWDAPYAPRRSYGRAMNMESYEASLDGGAMDHASFTPLTTYPERVDE